MKAEESGIGELVDTRDVPFVHHSQKIGAVSSIKFYDRKREPLYGSHFKTAPSRAVRAARVRLPVPEKVALF